MEIALGKQASSSSLRCSITTQLKYDVFLSFRGDDTRKSFTSHLFAALERDGFYTFKDDKELKRGENIDFELLKAIEESRMSLVVISKNYAGSRWCLDELVKIMECRENFQQIVFPIFHGVEPSDVRAQNGSLADAFSKHAERFGEGPGSKVEKWKEALTQVANLSGWDLPKVDNGDEAKLIQKIVKEVRNRLDLAHPHTNVTTHQVGLESRLQELNPLLSMESSSVRIVGICGIGGIGKTTIAMKQYYLIRHMFEGSSFLANVRESWKQINGQVLLQRRLLSDMCTNGTYKVRDRCHGIGLIKRRAFRRKILLVLDDVDDVEQFKALAIDQKDSFVPGSRIIITTRDASLLKWIEVDKIYELEGLNRRESLKLLSWHAFKGDHPREGYWDLSGQVVDYAGGLPLAIEVLGPYLHGKSIHEWESAILKLRNCPDAKIQKTLKISYDSLDRTEQELFLDIACFFVGEDRDCTIKRLESCQKFAVNGIRDLENRCLVKNWDGRLVMHDMLQEMGREIVRRESKMLGKRSRLWHHEDAREVLESGQGTKKVEGLFLNFHELTEVQVDSKALAKMNGLWLLHLGYVQPRGGFELISRSLMWLCWNGFPLECLPSDLHMGSLVTLDLRYSSLKKLWEGTKVMNKLKFLYLSHCYYLIETPDFSGLNNLEELLLNDCIRLVEVDESIRFLNKLLALDMRNCKKLRKFPFGILMLKCLESLDTSGCSMLENHFGFKGSLSEPLFSSLISRTNTVESIGLSVSHVLGLSCCLKNLRMENCNISYLPNEVGNLILLEKLDLSKNNLCTLPDSICNLTRLTDLKMEDCNLSCLPNEFGNLISLRDLNLNKNNLLTLPDSLCNLACLVHLRLGHGKFDRLPNRFGMLSSLELLYLDGNSNLQCLPNSFSDLACLYDLCLEGCGRLQSLPPPPVSLVVLDVVDCTSLKSIPTESYLRAAIGRGLYFNGGRGCDMLARNNFANDLMDLIGQSLSSGWPHGQSQIQLPRDEIPNWFQYQYQYTGSKISLVVPTETRRIRGWFFCTVFTYNGKGRNLLDLYDELNISVKMSGKRGNHEHKFSTWQCSGTEDQLVLCYTPANSRDVDGDQIHGGDEFEIVLSSFDPPKFTVKKCGIHFVYDDDEDITGMPIKKQKKSDDLEV